MKKSLIDNKLNLGSALLFNVFIFLCATNLRSMPSIGQLPTSFPTEPVSAIPQPSSNVAGDSSSQPGPDNIAVSDDKAGEQGNWVKKKQWLLKSFELNNNIYSLALQIADTRNIYSSKNDTISDDLQIFYKNLGLEQGKIQEMFDSVERHLEKKKKKGIAILLGSNEKKSENDRDFQVKIELLENQVKNLKDELEQFKLDMKSIEDIGKSLVQRLEKVDEQISSAMGLAETAKSKVEGLWEIIDDKKARVIYYDLASIEENLKVILTYLKDTLSNDFDGVIQTAKKQINSANEGIKKLEERGLIIKDRAKRVEQLKLQELQKIEQEKDAAVKQQVAPKQLITNVEQAQHFAWWKELYNLILEFSARAYHYISNYWKGVSKIENSDQKKDQLPVIQPITQSNVTVSSAPLKEAVNDQSVVVPPTSDQVKTQPPSAEDATKKTQLPVMQLIQ